ncbi:hypothetical protein EGW08_022456 [Elysia chlorotica]|uniref:Thioredoxin domain-containing protein n=1 Tax=Elysia chlorotica TaxID=188477 RepID=A0A3S1AXH2_ELYCH|nr:hypothetical protein EGW08_022456 [Elysia chlorotica]
MLETLFGAEGEEMAKKLNQGEEVVPFLQSRSIKQLGERNFNKFLREKDTALVLFYQPDCHMCMSAKPHFMKAAINNPGRGRGYGIVDCSRETDLCDEEKIRKFPSFKLYVGGKLLGSYNQIPHYETLGEFVANAPAAPTNMNHKKHVRDDL